MLDYLTIYSFILAARAEQLIPLLVIAFLCGEWLAKLLQLDAMAAKANRFIAALDRKLNRAKRGAATVIYRGLIALVIIVVPMVVLGGLLAQKTSWATYGSALLLIAIFGRAFATYQSLRLWQRARKGDLALELPRSDFLFADTHAVIRYQILTRLDAFAILVVGGCFWYVLGDLPLMFGYYAIMATAAQYRSRFFGWAARNVASLVNFIPQLIARWLLLLAAIFTPQTKLANPFTGRGWRYFIARLLHVALGGPLPQGEEPWVGEGTAKVTHQHLRRALHLEAVGTLLLLLVLAGPNVYKALINIV